MTKLNPQTMKTQYDGQYDTFCRKNHDYGNSFEESLDQFGIVASIVRMSDKMKRLESLTDESKTQQVGSESLLDTLEDLSNYAAMTVCWLRGIREEDGETSCGPDMIDVIKYNVQDVKNVMARSAEMEKEFNKHIPSKVENFEIDNFTEKLSDLDYEVVSLLKQVENFHHKIEEFKMTEEDHKALEEIINRLRSIIEDAPISKQGMVDLIHTHVKLNPDVLIFQLYNPVREIFNNTFLDIAKSTLNDLFDNIILCRDQNIPLPKRLTYCSYREEKYEQIAALVLTGNIDFGEVSRIVNDYPNLRVAEKNHLLQSIVSAAYKISDEPENEKPEFLNKKFHIPDEILEDLKEPEEEPERKRTVLGMIFPFRL